MTAAPESHRSAPPDRKLHKRLAILAFLAGIVVVFLVVRRIPPPPPFSPEIGRATYWQSYESSYFASLRSYEALITEVIARGQVPIVVLGDSTLRGTGARENAVWTRVLEEQLQRADTRLRVLNFAQNGGDRMAPFLYHHLRLRFPEAYFILQWHFGSRIGSRHPFHYWLTSEIMLRDGNRNPAIAYSLEVEPIKDPAERGSLVMAALNIGTNYLDLGNWVRYRWLGYPEVTRTRSVRISCLADAPDREKNHVEFTPIEPEAESHLQKVFVSFLENRRAEMERPSADRKAYFDRVFPPGTRGHLLLISLDLSPHYAPINQPELMETWRNNWRHLRAEMANFPDLRWLSITGADGGMTTGDFLDAGHLTVAGQQHLAQAVAAEIAARGGWLDPTAPGALPAFDRFGGRWVEPREIPPYRRTGLLETLTPAPSRFFSSFGLARDSEFLSVHPRTQLRFPVSAGKHTLRTTIRFVPAAYETTPDSEPTDGVSAAIKLISPARPPQSLYDRYINPAEAQADRGDVPITLSFDAPADCELEFEVGPGPQENYNRDWAYIGPLTIE